MPDEHYTLLEREGVPELRRLIDRRSYFVLHAPRQTGKTTALIALSEQLTREGRYTSAVLSLEVGAPFADDLEGLELAVLGAWRMQAAAQLPAALQPPDWPEAPRGTRVGAALAAWSESSQRPLVLFLDEIDALRDHALITVLRQLRAGFPGRPDHFPHSLALVGLRDVRDYLVAAGGSERLGTASPFNIKTASVRIRDFTPDEVARLLGQHTDETGSTRWGAGAWTSAWSVASSGSRWS